eukprot:gene6320-10327_t
MIEGEYSLEEYYDNITDMGTISKYLGAHYAQLSEFFKIEKKIESILDFGCGAGSFSLILSNYFKKTKIVGVDTNKNAIEFANSRLSELNEDTNVEFKVSNQNELVEKENSYDIVTCSMVCHHIPRDDQISQFLKDSISVSKQFVIIRDLERDPFSILAFKYILTPIFTNKLTIADGLLSIRRSFTREEWLNYLIGIGLNENEFKILWKPVSQWLIVINSEMVKNRIKNQ